MTILMAVLVVGVVATVVAYPLFRPAEATVSGMDGPDAELAALEERKLQLYAAIRELGFDFHTDKLEKEDYEEEVERLKTEAVGVMREIDGLRQRSVRGPDALEAEIARLRQTAPGGATAAGVAAAGPGGISAAGPGGVSAAASVQAPAAGTDDAPTFCTQCGTAARTGDRFCSGCGTPLRTS